MHIYQGLNERGENGGFIVLKDGKPLSPRPSQEVYNHSPCGFNWGYGGSGPAQLALALLLDVTGDKKKSLGWHQKFKWEKIAKLDMGETWEMTSEEVEIWLNQKEG